MNRKDAIKVRAARALEVIRRRADDDDWERVIEALETEALRLTKIKPEGQPATNGIKPWWMP